jgi:transposase
VERFEQLHQNGKLSRPSLQRVHRVLQTACGVIINRDINACRNMFLVLLAVLQEKKLDARPAHLSRT